MYINFKVLEKSGLKSGDVEFLIAVKQKELDYLIMNLSESDYSLFKASRLIEHVKVSKKGEHPYMSLRLSREGKKLLSELEEAETLEEDKKVHDWLLSEYEKRGKQPGNKARTLRDIRDFRIKSGIEKNNLIRLCLHFLNSEDNMEFNNVLQYAFYKPPTAFATRFDLEESRLWKHFLKFRAEIESTFEEY